MGSLKRPSIHTTNAVINMIGNVNANNAKLAKMSKMRLLVERQTLNTKPSEKTIQEGRKRSTSTAYATSF